MIYKKKIILSEREKKRGIRLMKSLVMARVEFRANPAVDLIYRGNVMMEVSSRPINN